MSDNDSNIPGPGTTRGAFAASAADKDSALLDAVKTGNPELVIKALAAGADINTYNDNKDTPLTLAARQGTLEIVKVLLHVGADPLRRNNDGQTALMASWTVMQELNRRSEAGQSPDPAEDAKSAYNYGLIGGLLYQAEKSANDYAVSSCNNGVRDTVVVRGPLKLKTAPQ